MIEKLLHEVDRVLGDMLEGTNVLCAVSGGPDSMALLHILLRLKEKRGFGVSAAHFNHGIRLAAMDDENFITEQCAQWSVPLITGRADVPQMAATEGKTLEQAARDARYAFLRQTAAAVGADKIVLGHHMDDQAETLLLNLMRGTGLSGLRGMQSIRNDLIRPLLCVRRTHILTYLAENSIPYRIDETNACEDYTRNRVRKLIAELENGKEAFVENVARTAMLLTQDDEVLAVMASRLRKEIAKGTGVDAVALQKAEPALSTRVIRLLATEAGLTADFEYKHMQSVLDLCKKGRTGTAICLAHGFEARLDYGAITVAQKVLSERIKPIALNLDGMTRTSAGDFFAQLVDRPATIKAGGSWVVYVNPDAVKDAVIRSRQEGDRIHPLGAGGSKKLKDFFIDKKWDKRMRNLPLLTLESDILWAVGCALSEKVRINEQQQVLRLEFLPAQHWQNCTLFDS